MKIFKDSKGREWKLELNLSSVKEINERLKTLGADFLTPSSFIIRLSDVFFVCDCLYCVVHKQAESKNVSSYDFGEALYGQVFWDARKALIDEYLDFFPDPNARECVRKTQEETDAALKKVYETLKAETTKRMTTLSENFGAMLSKQLDQLDLQNSED